MFTVMVPGFDAVMVELLSAKEPLQAGAPSNASKTAEVSVTGTAPLVIAGCRVPVPEAETIRSSGFRYHSDAGGEVWAPLTTNRVMLYGAKVCVALQDCEGEGVTAPGLVETTEYAV